MGGCLCVCVCVARMDTHGCGQGERGPYTSRRRRQYRQRQTMLAAWQQVGRSTVLGGWGGPVQFTRPRCYLNSTKLACNSPPDTQTSRKRKEFLHKMLCVHINLYYSEQTGSAGRDCGFAGTFKLSLNWKAIKSLCLQIINLIVPQIWPSP